MVPPVMYLRLACSLSAAMGTLLASASELCQSDRPAFTFDAPSAQATGRKMEEESPVDATCRSRGEGRREGYRSSGLVLAVRAAFSAVTRARAAWASSMVRKRKTPLG